MSKLGFDGTDGPTLDAWQRRAPEPVIEDLIKQARRIAKQNWGDEDYYFDDLRDLLQKVDRLLPEYREEGCVT